MELFFSYLSHSLFYYITTKLKHIDFFDKYIYLMYYSLCEYRFEVDFDEIFNGWYKKNIL